MCACGEGLCTCGEGVDHGEEDGKNDEETLNLNKTRGNQISERETERDR